MNIRQKEFSKWLKSKQGARLTAIEKDYLKILLENIYGSHALLLADPAQIAFADVLQVNDHVLVHPSKTCRAKEFISAKYSALPIAPDSMQVVLMPHTLEFVSNPHQVLREMEKVVRPEGHVIILGFNPMSLCGLRRFFSNRGIWAGEFRSVNKVKDWLTLLGFDVVKSSYHKFLPSIETDSDFIEELGKKICPVFAGLYVVIAKKTILGMTPQRPEWKRKTNFIKKGLVKPAARDICRD